MRPNRLVVTEHTARPWRIHQIAPDFEIEDVWAYRTPGAGREDFPLMLTALRATGGLNENPPLVRLLFAVRWRLGTLFGWDKPQEGLDGRLKSLCDRLPDYLQQESSDAAVPNTPFTLVYQLEDECVIELANKTVHGLCHLGWVPTADDEYELRMAVLTKPNGLLGRAYMAAIKPFRYLIVYPALTRIWERAWLNREGHPAPGSNASRAAPMISWAGGLIVFFGAAHTLGALTALGAARHAGAWFSRELWRENLADMSPAMSAYWLSINSFGPPLILLGLIVLWLNRRDIIPPSFIAWALGGWIAVDTVLGGPGVGQNLILLAAAALLVAASRRAKHREHPATTVSAAMAQARTSAAGREVRGE